MKNKSLSCVPCFSWFHFPENCCVNQRIGKVLFAENGPLTPADRQTFKNEIEEAVCVYVLKPDNAYLNLWADGEHGYDCLAVIEITLRKTGKAERIAELFHRTMPYPLLLVLKHETHEECEKRGIMFSMAEKRFSRNGREQVVIEHMVNTPWRQDSGLEAFYAEADYAKFCKTTFRELYKHYMNLLEALNCSLITGKLHVTGIDPEVRRKLLAKFHQLEQDLLGLKTRAKRESEMAQLIELNMQAGKIKNELHEIRRKLSENHG